MRIAIIGTGNVGTALGEVWTKAGHEVKYGSRRPDPDAGRVSIAEAAAFGEVVVLANPWPALEETLHACGDLSGKTVVDCTNPLRPNLSGLELGTDTSAAEKVAKLAPGSNVVKAFNTVGANIMSNSHFPQGKAVMFYCGDNELSKRTVHELAAAAGFEPIDAGPLTQARVLEPFAMLWISLAYGQGLGREFAFQLMRR